MVRRPYAVRRPVENAFLVRERETRFAREMVRVFSAVVLVGLGLLAYTWIRIEITAVGYRIDSLENELHDLRQEERRLELEATYPARPERVEERAADELHMRRPTIAQTVFFEELVP
jgi:cell division protein FtsL